MAVSKSLIQKVTLSLSSKGQVKTSGMTLPNKWTDLARKQPVRMTFKSGKSIVITSLGCGIWAKDNDPTVLADLIAYIEKMGGAVMMPVTIDALPSMDAGKGSAPAVDGDF